MKLIALILGLLLERTATQLLSLRELRWLEPLFDLGFRATGARAPVRGYAAGVIAVALPVLPVLALQLALQDLLRGALWLAFAAFVLIFSLGPRDLGREVREYLEAAERGDAETAGRVAREITEARLPRERGRRVLALEEAVLVHANKRLFGVIFWFMILGPAGAWLFRVADLMRRRAVFEAGRRHGQDEAPPDWLTVSQALAGVLAWIPARLLALTYAMAGSFEEAVSDWRGYYATCSDKFFHVNDEILAYAGRGAIRETSGEGELAIVGAAKRLVERSLLIWVTFIALLTLAGWTL